jgi:hypothetical protein
VGGISFELVLVKAGVAGFDFDEGYPYLGAEADADESVWAYRTPRDCFERGFDERLDTGFVSPARP